MSCERNVMIVSFRLHLQSWRHYDLLRQSGLERSYLGDGRRWDCHPAFAGSSMEKHLIRSALMQSPVWAMLKSGDLSVVVFSTAECYIRFILTSCRFRY